MKKLKTIFFTLSVTSVYRNLLFFPGSVFDRLKTISQERDDLRFVFLVPHKDMPKYIHLNSCDWHDRLIIESVTVYYPQLFLEKLFYFFYSYFIYTGTTWQLSTLGVRPEEPPAGGIFKHYLAPLKILIARTFGKSHFMREKFVPYLYHKVFKKKPFAELFSKYSPDLIFVSHIYGRLDTELLAEAKRQGIKTIGMASNWDHFDKYYLPFKVDALLAQSEQMKDFAVRFQGYNAAHIFVVGYPHFDFMLDTRYVWSRSEILKYLGFPPNCKFILYVSGSAYCPDETDIIEEILKWADADKLGYDTRIVIRPYQGGRAKDREFDEVKYNRFESHPRVAFYRKEFWGDMEKSIQFVNIMRHADLVIAIYSTAMIEAAALDRPLIGIFFDGHKKRSLQHSIRRFAAREHFQDVWKSGAVSMTKNFDELRSALVTYLYNPDFNSGERETIRRRVCGSLDGRSSERIVKHIIGSVI